MIDRLHWLGHASMLINGFDGQSGATIYIDPYLIPTAAPPADLILISHDHHDHCSPADIEKIITPNTVIMANERTARLLLPYDVTIIRAWQGGVRFENAVVRAVPAYTLGRASHTIEFGGLGFILSIMRYDVYFAGDTDMIPEMEKISCDVALLPVGGETTMDSVQAAEAVKVLRPLYAFPIHYGREVPGTEMAGKRFCQQVLAENPSIGSYELPLLQEFA